MCEEELGGCTPEDLSQGLGVRQVTRTTCYNGAHTLGRITSTLAETMPEAKSKLNELRQQNLPLWRTFCISMCSESFGRAASQRVRARTFVER